MHPDIERILVDEHAIRGAIQRLAREIASTRSDRPLSVVVALKGAFVFAADLVRAIDLPLELEFASASSYRDGTRPGALELAQLPSEAALRGRDVLLVDDVCDTGRTLRALQSELARRGAARVRTCVLLQKPAARPGALRADLCGIEIPDVFVVGYGLDCAGAYRQLPYIGSLRAEALARRVAGACEASAGES